MTTARPFRHLCPEADERDAMSDDEFWDHVLGTRPTWDIDDESPDLDAWTLDYYEQTASTVDGVRMTAETRAPGWVSTRLNDYCPEHALTEAPR